MGRGWADLAGSGESHYPLLATHYLLLAPYYLLLAGSDEPCSQLVLLGKVRLAALPPVGSRSTQPKPYKPESRAERKPIQAAHVGMDCGSRVRIPTAHGKAGNIREVELGMLKYILDLRVGKSRSGG